MYMGCKICSCIKGISQLLLIRFLWVVWSSVRAMGQVPAGRERKQKPSSLSLSPAPLHPDLSLPVTEQFIKLLMEKGYGKG